MRIVLLIEFLTSPNQAQWYCTYSKHAQPGDTPKPDNFPSRIQRPERVRPAAVLQAGEDRLADLAQVHAEPLRAVRPKVVVERVARVRDDRGEHECVSEGAAEAVSPGG